MIPFRSVTTKTPCPLCGGTSATTVATRDGKTGKALHTVQCNGCGLGYTDPLPTPSELAAYYENVYRQDYKAASEPQLRHVLRAARNAARRWQWLREKLPIPAGARTLDIGASSGEFVFLASTLGYRATGFEPHKGYAGFGVRELGVDVRQGTLEANLPSVAHEKFDVVSMFHVLEHLPDPVATLRQLSEALSDHGVLYIEVPDATRFGSPHYMFFRAHLLYFTRQSLRSLARAAGLDVVADNANEPDELRVVLKRAASRYGAQSFIFSPQSALVEAQRQRRWAPYLLNQFASGAGLKKLARRHEEKRTARALGTAKAIIERANAEHIRA
jgi:SAM-dependent methyltransferase